MTNETNETNEDEAREHAEAFNSGYTLALRDAGLFGRPRWPAEQARTDALNLALRFQAERVPVFQRDDADPMEASDVLDTAAEFLAFIEGR